MTDCTIDAACDTMVSALEAKAASVAGCVAAQAAEIAPLLLLLNGEPGEFVARDEANLATLASMVQRVSAATFGSGICDWRFTEPRRPGAGVIILPAVPALCVVRINSVPLVAGTDYTITGLELVLAYALAQGDELWVRTYGEASP